MSLSQIPPADETPQDQLFQITEERITATGTWTRPTGVDYVEVIVVGGGGAGGAVGAPGAGSSGGGGGGAVIRRFVPVSGPVPVTIGAGGTTGRPSFDPLGQAFSGNGGTTTWAGPVPVVAPGGGGGGNGDTAELSHGRNGASGGGAGMRLDFFPNYSLDGASAGGGAGGPAIQDGRWHTATPSPGATFFKYGGSGTHGGAGGSGAPVLPRPHPQQMTPDSTFSNVSSAGGPGLYGFGGGGGVRDEGSGSVDGGGANTTLPAPSPFSFRAAQANTGGGGFGGFTPAGANRSGGSGIVVVRYTT